MFLGAVRGAGWRVLKLTALGPATTRDAGQPRGRDYVAGVRSSVVQARSTTAQVVDRGRHYHHGPSPAPSASLEIRK
jgi:hypothetical protein